MQDFNMSYLDRRHYQLLIAIRRLGQLSAAADELGLTQPAASHQIREAERRLGIRLFDREGRRIKLTKAGERLLEAALYTENTLRSAETDAVRLHNLTTSPLRIAVGSYDHTCWLPAVAAKIDAGDLPWKVELIRLAHDDLGPAITSGRADLFLAPSSPELENLPSYPLFEDTLVAVLPPDADPGTPISAEFFETRRFLAFSYHPAQGFEYERYLSPAGVIPKNLLRVESAAAIIELVAAGFGVSILPMWCALEGATSGRVVVRELAPEPLRIGWHFFGRAKLMEKDIAIRALASAISESARKAFQPILRPHQA